MWLPLIRPVLTYILDVSRQHVPYVRVHARILRRPSLPHRICLSRHRRPRCRLLGVRCYHLTHRMWICHLWTLQAHRHSIRLVDIEENTSMMTISSTLRMPHLEMIKGSLARVVGSSSVGIVATRTHISMSSKLFSQRQPNAEPLHSNTTTCLECYGSRTWIRLVCPTILHHEIYFVMHATVFNNASLASLRSITSSTSL